MIFAILLGITEGIVERYIGGLEINLSNPINEIGEIISDQRNKLINDGRESENKYLK